MVYLETSKVLKSAVYFRIVSYIVQHKSKGCMIFDPTPSVWNSSSLNSTTNPEGSYPMYPLFTYLCVWLITFGRAYNTGSPYWTKLTDQISQALAFAWRWSTEAESHWEVPVHPSSEVSSLEAGADIFSFLFQNNTKRDLCSWHVCLLCRRLTKIFQRPGNIQLQEVFSFHRNLSTGKTFEISWGYAYYILHILAINPNVQA